MAQFPSQPTVLIVTDDRKFTPALISQWQQSGGAPDFVCMTGDVPVAEATSSYSLAIVGPLNAARAEAALDRLSRAARPVIFVSRDSHLLDQVRSSPAAPVCVRQHGNWIQKVLRYASAAIGCPRDDSRAASDFVSAERELLLGRCVLEMRPTLNNALTLILGNAELMLLDQLSLPSAVREQAATIHEMALRIDDIFRRMASLETELQVGSGEPIEVCSDF